MQRLLSIKTSMLSYRIATNTKIYVIRRCICKLLPLIICFLIEYVSYCRVAIRFL
jgi:hypothetical protein